MYQQKGVFPEITAAKRRGVVKKRDLLKRRVGGTSRTRESTIELNSEKICLRHLLLLKKPGKPFRDHTAGTVKPEKKNQPRNTEL